MPATDVVAYLSDARTPTVRGFIDNLRKAKSDNRVRAVLLKPTTFSSPYWGKMQEIRDALVDFKESGKPLYAYLEYGGDREYYLASAADKVFLMPASTLDLTGVATYQVFLRGTFDKIGVTPDIHHVGDFKTASNQYTEKGYTPSHRAMDEWLNRELYEQIVSAHRARAEEERRGGARADRRGPVPGRARATRGPGRRAPLRGSGRREAEGRIRRV